MIDWLFDMMDLPKNLDRAIVVVDQISGLTAIIFAGVLFYLAWLLWPWLYYFDIESTAVWTDKALQALSVTMSNGGMPMLDTYRGNGESIGWFVTGSTYLPTMIELFATRFAQGGIRVAHFLVIFFSTFDLVTDKDRVWAFVDQLGVTGLLSWALKIPLLLLASFGFQSLFIIFVICGIRLVMNIRGARAVARMA